ncbi:testis-expressed protein 33 [Colossoma macropomum]|uniref:testis-expressed protein 33 n=1 Tax=Colossoma macropomum TaxID=42526 RepID=UPI001864E8E5|nr:testis-expressed protein 33 [Colossoma macropomum]
MTSTDEPEPVTQKEALVQKLEAPLVPPLCVPHYSDSSSVFTDKHRNYHMLGHCLRTDIFPGAPIAWSSLIKDSYINYSLQSPPPDPQCWYGRRTDDMMRWTERNIINQKLQKALREMEQKNMPK